MIRVCLLKVAFRVAAVVGKGNQGSARSGGDKLKQTKDRSASQKRRSGLQLCIRITGSDNESNSNLTVAVVKSERRVDSHRATRQIETIRMQVRFDGRGGDIRMRVPYLCLVVRVCVLF